MAKKKAPAELAVVPPAPAAEEKPEETPAETGEETSEETPPKPAAKKAAGGGDWKQIAVVVALTVGGLWLFFGRKNVQKPASAPEKPAPAAPKARFGNVQQL